MSRIAKFTPVSAGFGLLSAIMLEGCGQEEEDAQKGGADLTPRQVESSGPPTAGSSLFASSAVTASDTIPYTSHMPAGGAAATPTGLIGLCQHHPEACAERRHADGPFAALEENARRDHVPFYLDRRVWHELQQVNTHVNSEIHYKSDQDHYGTVENWTLPETFDDDHEGDCEDYALEKRHRLLKDGFPAEDLILAQVWSQQTGYHAVLVVVTDHGDFVLDNATPWVLPWDQAGYVWQSRQVGDTMMHWSTVEQPRWTSASATGGQGAPLSPEEANGHAFSPGLVELALD